MARISRKKKSQITATLLALLLNGSTLPVAGAASVVEDDEFKLSRTLEVINAKEAYDKGYSGQGVNIVISDRLINAENPEFAGKNITYLTELPSDYDWSIDDYAHGTHVAGIAAAARNGIGMQGVAYNASVYSTDWGDFEALDLIDDSSMKIINNSWGVLRYPQNLSTSDAEGLTFESFTEKIGKDYAEFISSYLSKLNGKDVLSIRGMGNDGHTLAPVTSLTEEMNPNYKVEQLNITNLNEWTDTEPVPNTNGMKRVVDVNGTISITGTTLLHIFSNLAMFNEERTVAAPGVNIFSANANYAADGNVDVAKNGTSMATPVVSGIAALVFEAFPYLSAKQLKDVILTTANKNIVLSDDGKIQVSFQIEDNYVKYVNVYYIGDGTTPVAERTLEQIKDDIKKIVRLDPNNYMYTDEILDIFCDDFSTNLIAYYDVPIEEFVGQGVVDAGKAVNGLGNINLRNLTKDDIRTFDKEYVSGSGTQQALYAVDTKGYDSVWSNDIGETQVDKLSYDTSQSDLKSRYNYYYKNYLDNSNQNAAVRALVKDYVKIYNENVDANGLKGLHGGLLKTGTGSLTLTGKNTYQGVSVASGGTLYIDGSVAGGARSENAGTIAGKGVITGLLDNANIAMAGSRNATSVETLTADSYTGSGDAYVQMLNLGTESATNTNFKINGNAKLEGGSLLPSITGELYPYDGSNTAAFTADSFTGTFANNGADNAKALSATLGAYAKQNGKNYGIVIAPQLNISNPNTDVQEGFDVLNEVYAAQKDKGVYDPTLANIFNQSAENARSSLAGIIGGKAADGVNLVQHFTTASSAIAPRLAQVFHPSTVTLNVKPMGLVGDSNLNAVDVVVPLDNTEIEGIWMKYNRTWGDYGSLHGHGTALNFGYDHAAGEGKRVGVFGSYGTNSYASDSSKHNIYDYRLGIYGGMQHGNADAYAYIDYGWQNYTGSRSMNFGTASNKHKGHLLELGGEYRYNLSPEKVWQVRPYVNMQMSRDFQDAYSESGLGSLGMNVHSGANDYFATEVGVDLSRNVGADYNYGVRVGYKHLWAGANPNYEFDFGSDKGITRSKNGHLDKDLLTLKAQVEQQINHSNWFVQGEVGLERGRHDKSANFDVTLQYRW